MKNATKSQGNYHDKTWNGRQEGKAFFDSSILQPIDLPLVLSARSFDQDLLLELLEIVDDTIRFPVISRSGKTADSAIPIN